MTVAAKVVNLCTVVPRADMVFGLDTNVLFWLGYSKATTDPDVRRRVRPYSNFITKALSVGAHFQCTALNLVEAIHLIERTEFDLTWPTYRDIKKFREVASNRESVGNEIDVLWATATQTTTLVPSSLAEPEVRNMLRNQRLAEIGAYDMGILESYSVAGVKMVLSDDRDFSTYDSDVTVLTANPRCLEAAVAQNKLHPADKL